MTDSPEVELAEAIWDAMLHHQVSTPYPVEFCTSVTELAKAYAAGDSDELTAARREVLSRATEPTVPPVVAGGGGQPRRRELGPSGSRAQPPGGATLSTGPSIPYPGHGLFNLRPQPVDKP